MSGGKFKKKCNFLFPTAFCQLMENFEWKNSPHIEHLIFNFTEPKIGFHDDANAEQLCGKTFAF